MSMLPMCNLKGEKFALMIDEPDNQQNGWIFYDNHGTWVTLRPAFPHELERGKQLLEFAEIMKDIPCRG